MEEWSDEIVDISEERDRDMRIDWIAALAKDARPSARRSHAGDNLEWEIVAPERLGIYAIWCDGYSTGLPPGGQICPDRIIRSLPELML